LGGAGEPAPFGGEKIASVRVHGSRLLRNRFDPEHELQMFRPPAAPARGLKDPRSVGPDQRL